MRTMTETTAMYLLSEQATSTGYRNLFFKEDLRCRVYRLMLTMVGCTEKLPSMLSRHTVNRIIYRCLTMSPASLHMCFAVTVKSLQPGRRHFTIVGLQEWTEHTWSPTCLQPRNATLHQAPRHPRRASTCL